MTWQYFTSLDCSMTWLLLTRKIMDLNTSAQLIQIAYKLKQRRSDPAEMNVDSECKNCNVTTLGNGDRWGLKIPHLQNWEITENLREPLYEVREEFHWLHELPGAIGYILSTASSLTILFNFSLIPLKENRPHFSSILCYIIIIILKKQED